MADTVEEIREQIYPDFSRKYALALEKADFTYQGIFGEIFPYQKIVNQDGEEVGRVDGKTEFSNFVIEPKTLLNGNIQEPDIYFYKEPPLTMTIPSGIEGYPDYGPFNIDPIDHTGPEETRDKVISKKLLSEIYGNIFSGYTSPVLFSTSEIDFLLQENIILRENIKNIKEILILLASQALATNALGLAAVGAAIDSRLDNVDR